MLRNFFPGDPGNRNALRKPNEQDAAVGLVNKAANRRLSRIETEGARAFQPGAGQQATPDQLRASAAYQLLLKKAQGAGGGPAGLAAKADLQEFTEQQAMQGASRDIERDWRGEIGTEVRTDPYTGRRVDGDAQHLTKRAASAIANNTALGKASPMAAEPRLEDPRLTSQYRNEMQRRTSANPMDALRARVR